MRQPLYSFGNNRFFFKNNFQKQLFQQFQSFWMVPPDYRFIILSCFQAYPHRLLHNTSSLQPHSLALCIASSFLKYVEECTFGWTCIWNIPDGYFTTVFVKRRLFICVGQFYQRFIEFLLRFSGIERSFYFQKTPSCRVKFKTVGVFRGSFDDDRFHIYQI